MHIYFLIQWIPINIHFDPRSGTFTFTFCFFWASQKEPEIKLPTTAGSSKNQESSRKTSISALLTMPKALTLCITTNCGKSLKRWEYQTTWPASWEICMQVRKQQLELDTEQTCSKWEKEYVKAEYCHPAYLTYIQSTSGHGTTDWFQIGKGVHQGCI